MSITESQNQSKLFILFYASFLCIIFYTLTIQNCEAQESFQLQQIQSKEKELKHLLLTYSSFTGLENLKDIKDTTLYLGIDVIQALNTVGLDKRSSVPLLINLLENDTLDAVRANAALFLGDIGQEASAAIPSLIRSLQNDKNVDVRIHAAEALGEIHLEAQTVVPVLLKVWRTLDTDRIVFWAANNALVNFGAETVSALETLIHKDTNSNFRIYAIEILKQIGPKSKQAINTLTIILQQDSDINVREEAAEALGYIGAEAKTAIPALIKTLKQKDPILRGRAADAIVAIADSLQTAKDTNAIPELKNALNGLIASGYDDEKRRLRALSDKKYSSQVKQAIVALEAFEVIERNRWATQVRNYISENKKISASLAVGLIFLAIWGLLLWKFPLSLLKIRNAIKLPSEIKLWKLPFTLRVDFLVKFFVYRPRVLDAWIRKHSNSAFDNFLKKSTVRDRDVHIATPIIFDNELIDNLTADRLHHKTLKGKRLLIFIGGEGDIGKTSLACQIAKWAISVDKAKRLIEEKQMIPVLIEEDLSIKVTSDKSPLIETIRGHLGAMIGQIEPIPEELVIQLLKQQRVLLIIDHFSEMNESTRGAIRPSNPDFSVNALVVTSRFKEKLDDVPKIAVEPCRFNRLGLASFLEKYLLKQNKQNLFTAPEYHDVCRQISLIVGDREITAMLVRMYADLIISQKEGTTNENLPTDIPDLMLNYLNYLNRDAKGNAPDDRTIHRIAKVIAWECLKSSYRPMPAKRDDLLAVLSNEQDVEINLNYLENRLRLIQTIGIERNQIRFNLDPLAEYLAGLHVVNQYNNNENLWCDFLRQADSVSNTPEAIKGFLIAVLDCCRVKSSEFNVPNFVLNEIGKRVNSIMNTQT